MHPRIKELLEQAGVKFVTMPDDTEYEKFAELLIRDCAKQVNHVYKQGGGTYGETILKTYNLSFK
jgi:hypothetical protein